MQACDGVMCVDKTPLSVVAMVHMVLMLVTYIPYTYKPDRVEKSLMARRKVTQEKHSCEPSGLLLYARATLLSAFSTFFGKVKKALIVKILYFKTLKFSNYARTKIHPSF